MNKRPKILVVGSLMMNHGIETSVIPEEGQTVMGEDIQNHLVARAQTRRFRWQD